MKKCTVLLMLFMTLYCSMLSAQSEETIKRELKELIKTYNIKPYRASWWTVDDVFIYSYEKPMVELVFKMHYENRTEEREEVRIKFNILKTNINKVFSGYGNHDKGISLRCNDGIEVSTTGYRYRTGKKQELPDECVLYTISTPIETRIYNGMLALQAFVKEQNISQISPHLFDNAKLEVGKISFVTPAENGILKKNETGCIQIEIKNTQSNDAYNVFCSVKEENESKLLFFEKYTTIDKIEGNKIKIINIPVKADYNINNGKHVLDVSILYNGITLKKGNVAFTTYNGSNVQNSNRIIKMRKMSGNTFLVSCKVNEFPLDFIFDTGASSVTLSRLTAMFMLKNGYLSINDIVGQNTYQTADGNISVGTVIRLKKIEIGGYILHNVEASIIDSDNAPLLLGQSALNKLGKIQIDYNNSTLSIIK